MSSKNIVIGIHLGILKKRNTLSPPYWHEDEMSFGKMTSQLDGRAHRDKIYVRQLVGEINAETETGRNN